ncbi:MAG: cation:proton antiporter, partial [bacterium]|nr:cation:proton antiporter [bacterium]
EDFLAVIVLLLLTSLTSIGMNMESILPFSILILKILSLFLVSWLLSKFLLSRLFKAVSNSGELLLLTALAWCFIYVSVATSLGFSSLIGAFLAGVSLASSAYHYQIQGKIKPMRDFFVALFFVYLGTQVNFADLGRSYLIILSFIFYSVVIKPVIFVLLFGMFGFKKHTMFHTAINMSQISEFSLIIILIGLKRGLIDSQALTVIAVCSIVSIIISSFLISRAGKLYKIVSFILVFFEREGEKFYLEENKDKAEAEDHVVIIGAHRVGGELVRFFKKENIPQLVLDFNPRVVEFLKKQKIPVIFGDMGDPEILEIMDFKKAKMIISTSPDLHDNKLLLEDLKNKRIFVPVIVRAETIKEATILYAVGADFVIIPEILAGEALLDIIKDHFGDSVFFKERARIETEKLNKKILLAES